MAFIVELRGDELVGLYKDVFAGAPWFEYMKCENCEVNYGEGEVLALKLDFGAEMQCKNCNEALKLMPFYEDEFVRGLISVEMAANGFAGVALELADKLVAFSWGFQVSKENTPSVKFELVNKLLEKAGLKPASLFYSAETGVVEKFQGRGIGTAASAMRLQKARGLGFDGVVFRTINPKLVQVYEKLFGDVKYLFNDPEAGKEERKWFFCDFKKMKPQMI